MLVIIMILISFIIIPLTYFLLTRKISQKYRLLGHIYNSCFLLLFVVIFLLETKSYWGSIQFFAKFGNVNKQTNQEVEFSLEEVKEVNSQIIELKEQVLLDAPIIKQYPELPRGCEVTSLAMLLQFANVRTDKLELAELVRKDNTPYRKEGGKVYFGNPNDGFVGDMHNLNNPGYGVYHKPIKELAEKYLPGEIQDITGKDFDTVKAYLTSGYPVWIITNATYEELSPSSFQLWETPTGQVKITYREHSVLVTGYDQKYIYFNDPISGEKNKKAPIQEFILAWVQMGSQAITYGTTLELD
jgi:uncharacterized protein YvpB